MTGNCLRASVTAATKKLMKPSLMPYFLTNWSWYFLRRSITGFMLTSLKVVSSAAVFWTSLRRWAMRARMRVMGTRWLGRRPAGTATGAAGTTAALGASTWAITSPLVTRPSLPVPAIAWALTPVSATILRTAGLSSVLTAGAAAAGAELAAGAAGASAAAGAPAAAFASVSMTASRSLVSTVSPSFLRIWVITPSCWAVTSSTTLSVSMPISMSPRETRSPTFLFQSSSVPSLIDSENTGTLTSRSMMSPDARPKPSRRAERPARA
ncbi:hypothetical protein D3C86_1144460 [compost metagenome]